MRCAVLFLLAATVAAEEIFPGEYMGWILKDRWGGYHLFNGAYRLHIDDKAAEKVSPFVGRPVKLVLTSFRTTLHSEENDVITGIGKIKAVKPDFPFAVSVWPTRSVHLGGRQRFQIEVRYEGKEPVTFRRDWLALMILRRATPEERKERRVRTVIVQERNSLNSWYWRSLRDSLEQSTLDSGTLTAKGPFTYEIEVGRRFPAGEYEVWAAYGDGNFNENGISAVSGLKSFRVAPRTQVRRDRPDKLIESFWRAARYKDEASARACCGPGLKGFEVAYALHVELARKFAVEDGTLGLGLAGKDNTVTVKTDAHEIVYTSAMDDQGWWITAIAVGKRTR